MNSKTTVIASCLLLALAVFAACGGEKVDEQATARDAEWTWLEETKADLDAARARAQELRDQLAAEEPAAEGEEPAEEAVDAEALHSELTELETEISSKSEEFIERLVNFINESGLTVDEEPGERLKAAFRMKSDEDILVAQTHIEEGGDYRQAINIYQAALKFDPDYDRLQQALASAEEHRFMSEERFSAVKKGMTEEEVREALGPVNVRNRHEYPGGRVGWFYPKSEEDGGGAAGVYFDDKGKVYKFEFTVPTADES
jgi:tetratricopeptide (TPR) repeat protein